MKIKVNPDDYNIAIKQDAMNPEKIGFILLGKDQDIENMRVVPDDAISIEFSSLQYLQQLVKSIEEFTEKVKLAETHTDKEFEPESDNTDGCISAELPKYQCHKIVHALKIKAIDFDIDLAEKERRETDASAIITPKDEGYAKFRVSSEYVYKHKPQPGGYYVIYEDGYVSWSPADAFESGYSKI